MERYLEIALRQILWHGKVLQMMFENICSLKNDAYGPIYKMDPTHVEPSSLSNVSACAFAECSDFFLNELCYLVQKRIV